MSEFIAYLVSGLAFGCSFALLGSGFVGIHRVTGVVNFAQGALPVVAGFVTYSMLGSGLPHGLAEVAGILVAAGYGLVIGIVAITRRGITPLSSLVITLGMGIMSYAIIIVIWGDQPVSYKMVGGTVDLLGAPIQRQYFVVIGATLLTFVAMSLFFGHTYVGKALSACASNRYAARLMGIRPVAMGLVSFALGGALGGLAGVVITPLQPVAFDADVSLAINGFAAAIFGGMNRINAVLAGGIALGITESLVAGYVHSSYQTEVALALMLGVLIWQARKRPTLTEEVVW